MFTPDEGIDNPQLFTHFGTFNPCWQLAADSDALMLSDVGDNATVAVELTAEQAQDIRSMTGVTSSRTMTLSIFGTPISVHLVGRKIDNWMWGGSAARYGDTETVVKDLENGLTFAEQVVSEVNSLVIILDSAGKIKRFNRLFEEITGVMESDVVGKNAFDMFVNISQREESRAGVSAFFSRNQSAPQTRPINTRNGVRMIQWRTTLMESGSGEPEKYLVCSGTDITEELRAQARLIELANTDALTGLPNRHAIQERITAAVTADNNQPFGLIFLDLDNFKKVNDHYGHLTGDALINEVAATLKGCLREQDVLARLGGDEFLIMVGSPDQRDAEDIARDILERMKQAFFVRHVEIYSGCSIGIAMFPEHGNSLEELVRSADTAMYVAKEEGKRMYRVFAAEMNNKVSEYMWLDNNMRRALDEHQFELYYQPKISMRTGKVESVEALLRWNHPERGLVTPVSFIPYAEESGLIVPLGRWVMETAARQAAAWKKQGLNLRIAINISARQLRNVHVVEEFTQALLENDLTPSLLDLELTESCLVEDEKQALALIRQFRDLGAQVHLDDFGTGYSSLSQLSRLPLDVLKLDGSFIKSVHSDVKARALVRSMVAVGHELNLLVVAECVETEEQVGFLKNIGVDYAQGDLFGAAMPRTDFDAWMPATSKRVLRLVA
ncbi:cyclic di-GMP phosphodiesterase [Herbaspirillum autotrophicum]|uniref:cyclic di-GMP phosphodiesterase n=1 Tax=Herbaspirillum autotrophicum TaxID=180195 RepID=UPI00067AE279|nr:cyclic di-GMP phosphodiesterase [Herbaspirillum autotrophicum]